MSWQLLAIKTRPRNQSKGSDSSTHSSLSCVRGREREGGEEGKLSSRQRFRGKAIYRTIDIHSLSLAY